MSLDVYKKVNMVQGQHDGPLTSVGVRVLCCLLTFGLSKGIQCHAGPHYFLCFQTTRTDIRPQVKRAVSPDDCKWLL